MSSYITNTKPTFSQVLLSKLGIIELPTKVNCWYCNQNSFLLSGSKNTAKHWYCHLCENTNIRDDNGDIVDPSPLETNSIHSRVPSVIRSPSIIKKNSENTLCDECQHNINKIQAFLIDYLPEETHPTYKQKCEHLDSYTADLHQRYKLCDHCRFKIIRLSEEQKEMIKRIKVNAVIKNSLNTKIPIKPKKHKFYFKGLFWILTHFTALAYACYSLLYPIELNFDLTFDFIHDIHLENITIDMYDYVIFIFQSIKTSDSPFKDYQLQLAFIWNALTFFILVWHPIQLNSYFDANGNKNWSIFKFTQYVLFLCRFFILYIIVSYPYEKQLYVMPITIIVYSALLFKTYNSITINTFKNLKVVGKSFSSFSESESRNASSFMDNIFNRRKEVEKTHSVQDNNNNNDDNELEYDNTFEDGMSIVSQETPRQNSIEVPTVDPLVAALNKIRF